MGALLGTGDALGRGREAFERRGWGEAVASLSAADQRSPLALDDLERLAEAAYLIGRDDESATAWTREHRESLRAGDPVRAARCAFWLAFVFLHKGDMARGAGWLGRARRILDEHGRDCVESGYLLVPAAIGSVEAGDVTTALKLFVEAGEIAERFADPDLAAIASMGRGRSLLVMGDITEGTALLDEAMVAVTAGEVSPIVAGDVYCGVIEGCRDVFDLRRAAEWTAALSDWCDSQPDLVLYRGQCLVHRAELMQLHGSWGEAVDEVRRAHERLSDPPDQPAVGAALYQMAELHRLRGESVEAEAAYRRASEHSRTPYPGLALLRLAQGQVGAAVAALRREVDEAHDPLGRSRLLPAYVEVLLSADDVGAARAASDGLSAIADDVGAPFLLAASRYAGGAVSLAEGKPRDALDELRRSLATWRELDAPYDAARVRVLIGVACRELGDLDAWEMELGAARSVFEHLGAVPALTLLAELSEPTVQASGGLTGREVEVLRLVAAGKTNRAIAAELFISEKTVARHVSNIFTKLDLPSRSAATAYAYEHDFVRRTP